MDAGEAGLGGFLKVVLPDADDAAAALGELASSACLRCSVFTSEPAYYLARSEALIGDVLGLGFSGNREHIVSV